MFFKRIQQRNTVNCQVNVRFETSFWDKTERKTSFAFGTEHHTNMATAEMQRQDKYISRFREVLPQVLASVACNFVLLDLNLSLAYPTILIAQLHRKEGPLSLDDVQASWLGK